MEDLGSVWDLGIVDLIVAVQYSTVQSSPAQSSAAQVPAPVETNEENTSLRLSDNDGLPVCLT